MNHNALSVLIQNSDVKMNMQMRMDTPSNQQDQLLENSIQNDDHAIVDDDGEAHSHTAGQETSSVGAVIDLEPQLNVNNRSPALEMGQQMFVPDSEDAVAVAREEGTIVQVAKVDDAQVSNEMSADQIPTETVRQDIYFTALFYL